MKITIPLKVCYRTVVILVLSILLYSKSYAQPSNDVCVNAKSLTEGSTCNNTTGQTLQNANATAGVPGTCGSATSADVWYKFTATSAFPVITISSLGSSLKTAVPVMQLLSGACGAFTSLACVTGNNSASSLALTTALTVGGAGIIAGNTYYIRVYTATNTGTASGANWGFSICVSDPSTAPATVDDGKSYVNVTKGTNGGTIEPGDTLEIRATFVVKANTAYQCSFSDVIPANTTYLTGTLRVLTNEGKIYQQFTDAADADAGTITGSAVTIRLGTGAKSGTGGAVANTSKPSFYGGTCIMVASYRVVVSTAAIFGTKVPVGFGTLKYYNSTGTTASTITFPADTINVYQNYGICPNTVGTNAIISESGGTFGSGSVKDRAASSKVPANYTYTAFSNSANMPNDYYYGVSNNTSGGTTAATGYSIINTYPYPTNPQRIFGVWDIIGDHTGAVSPTLGNPATDDNTGKTGGYMVVINASYRTDTAFLDTVSNLCPNTYYQYTAWFRNICSKCGCDSNGTGAGGGAGYIPTAPTDSSGVHPNLTFNINGYDYYTTGDIQYTGKWIQKGFTYLTGPAQTSMVINIRNNAPGGGGNDWAIDDIGVATCQPNISLTPNKPDTLCRGADDTVRFKVSSFFSNYTEWKLEKSVDGGTTWISPGLDTTGAASIGTGIPVHNSTTNQYEYLVTRYYRIGLTDALTKYRLTVASTVANLSNSNCALVNTTQKLIYGVDCQTVLAADIISFRGKLNDGLSNLQWVTANETGSLTYSIERSIDHVHFESIGEVAGRAERGNGATYQFTDTKAVGHATYYRISIISGSRVKYSNIILLSNSEIDFDVSAVTNPFIGSLAFEITAPGDDMVSFNLFDIFGRMIKREQQRVNKGLNNIRLYNLSNLASGTYTLQVQYADKIISKKVIKLQK